MGDFFAGSMNSHRRSRTATADSRTSTLTSNGSSSIGRFSRTSGTTAATSINEDESSPPVSSGSFSKSTSGRARSLSRGARKLVKRAKSPFGADPVSEPESPARPKDSRKGKGSYSRRRSMSTSAADVLEAEAAAAEEDEQSEWEAEERAGARPSWMRRARQMDESERDLTMRLELARQNSQNQHGREISTPGMEAPSEETIYEGMKHRELVVVIDVDFRLKHRRASTVAQATVEGVAGIEITPGDSTGGREPAFGHPDSPCTIASSEPTYKSRLSYREIAFAQLIRPF